MQLVAMPAFREYFYATKTDNNASNNGALLKQNQNKKQKKTKKKQREQKMTANCYCLRRG